MSGDSRLTEGDFAEATDDLDARGGPAVEEPVPVGLESGLAAEVEPANKVSSLRTFSWTSARSEASAKG